MEIIKSTVPQVTPDLSEQNIKELNKYLNFFKIKKEDTLKEIDLEFRDFSEDNLQDETAIYNQEDVKKMFQRYSDSIKKIVDNDLQKNARMSGVYVKNFMLEAQGKDILLEANLNMLEDIRLIDQMKQIEIGEGYKPIKDSSQLKGTNIFAKKIAQKLPNLLGNAMGGDDAQSQIEKLQKEIDELKKGGAGGDNSQLQSEIHDLKQKISDMEQEYQGVKSDLDKKLNESVQVNNLKKMIQQKNTQVKELKTKLAEFEK